MVETTYLLWQLVARSSRASRCLCFKSSSCRMFAFPVYSKIISDHLCTAIAPCTVLGSRSWGGWGGGAVAVLWCSSLVSWYLPAGSFLPRGRRSRTNRCTGLAQQCTNLCVSHVGRTCPQAEPAVFLKTPARCFVPTQTKPAAGKPVSPRTEAGPPAGLKEQINCDHFCKSELLKPFFCVDWTS